MTNHLTVLLLFSFFSLFPALSPVFLSIARLHPVWGRRWEKPRLQVRDEKKQTWCWYTGRYNTQEKRKRGKNNTHLSLCKIRRNEASASVWCGLDELVAAAAHPLNSRQLFESAAIELAVIEILKLDKSSTFWSSHEWINQQIYF